MTATIRQFALQKSLIPHLSGLQSHLWPESSAARRDIWFSVILSSICAGASSSLLLLPFPFWCHRLVFLFMTADDWSTLVLCQRCSRGEHSRTRTNENCHLLRGVQQTSEGMGMNVWVFLGLCVCVPSFPCGKRYLILAAAGRKTGQYVSANMCRRYERMQDLLIYPLWQDQWASHLTVQPASAVGRHWVKRVSEGKISSLGQPSWIFLHVIDVVWCHVFGCPAAYGGVLAFVTQMLPSPLWTLHDLYDQCDWN